MIMGALSPEAQTRLDVYLKQIRSALTGRPSIDADEVERDVLGHIDAELSGAPEPISASRLLEVLEDARRDAFHAVRVLRRQPVKAE